MGARTAILAILLLAVMGTVPAAEEVPVVYTNADLLRLFGPAAGAPAGLYPPCPSEPEPVWRPVSATGGGR